MFVSCPAARFHATSRTMCIYVYPCVCLHVRDMHAAARALSLFHSQGSAALSVFHALHACGSAGTFTLPLSRQRGGTWACLYVGGDGLPDCSAFEFVGLLGFAFESVVRVLWSCGHAGVVCAVMLSAICHAVSDACARPGTAPHHLLAAATREVRGGAGGAGFSLCSSVAGGAGGLAMEAWRWRLGAGGLVARRHASPCSWRGASGACRSWRGVARRGMWRGECRLWVQRA